MLSIKLRFLIALDNKGLIYKERPSFKGKSLAFLSPLKYYIVVCFNL